MPHKAPRPCRHVGCNALVTSKDGFCATHRKEVSIQYELTREKAVKRGYDTRWRKVRKMTLGHQPMCRGPLCNGEGSFAELVHHVDRNSKNNQSTNLLSVCTRCHEKIHHDAKERW